MNESQLTKFGFRARTALYLILNRGKWVSVGDIVRGTDLSMSTVIRACNFLVKNFPNLFETDGIEFRFKGFRGDKNGYKM